MDTGNESKKGNQGREFADKAEDFLTDKAKKVKRSEAFGKISGLLNQVEDFMEEQSEKFQSGETGAKLEALKGKAEEQAEEFWKKARDAGRKFGDQVDESIDKIKGKKDRTNYQNGGGI